MTKKLKLHELAEEELLKRLAESRLDLAKQKAQTAVGGAAAKPAQVKATKKMTARLLTELNKKKEKRGE